MQCHHCGREVHGTIHGTTSYKVDYYLLHTGHTEWEYFSNPKPDAPSLRYLKLTQPVDIFTCIDCYANADIRQRLEDDFAGRRPLIGFPERETHTVDPAAKG